MCVMWAMIEVEIGLSVGLHVYSIVIDHWPHWIITTSGEDGMAWSSLAMRSLAPGTATSTEYLDDATDDITASSFLSDTTDI